jgi:hypothetical protein
MNNRTYTSLNKKEKYHFFEYLRSIKATNTQAYANMWDDNWTSNANTLPYVLEQTDRFNDVNGVFHIIYNDSDIVACGGVYKSQFNDLVGIGGVRTWTNDKYRHQSLLREFLLPLHKSWCIENNIKIVALSFNEYNKNLIQVFKRRRLGEHCDRINNRQPHHLFYNGVNEPGFPVVIQYTKQWVIYEKLDPSFDFDWTSIRHIT